MSDERLQPHVARLRALAARQRLALGGAAAASGVLESEGVFMLTGDPIAEATLVSTLARGDATFDRRPTEDVAP